MNIYLRENRKNLLIQQLLHAGCICSIGCAIASATSASEVGDPVKFYSAIKTTVQDMVQNEHLLQKGGELSFNVDPSRPNERDLDLCLEWHPNLGVPTDSPEYFATTIALYLEVYQTELDSLKIPRAISAKSFGAMEALAITTLRSKSDKGLEALRAKQEQLAQDLNAYTKTRAGLPHFIVIGECGGGIKAEVTIKTTPAGGTVSYIPVFSYKLCQATHVDPNDLEKCGWKTAGNVEDLLGTYKFIATWPDGKKKTATIDVTGKKTVELSP